ncbi:MAG: glycosyltransferase family 2 protein [Lachnospiraceae bacterium]|jgi:glycosyltransferase involved in cell wall biosynthesis|nr:glycosyltransferase family 2 protein [Lachnospiraceae bacterium]
MQKKGLVSCVTPVWNGEQYLGQMLDSLLKQTYPSIEMILVDDGSTDGTLGVAESYRDHFTERGYDYKIVSVPHKNASAAINRGLMLAGGEYLIWPDSDDLLEPDSVRRRVEFLEANPGYYCVRSLMYYFDSSGQIGSTGEQIGDTQKEELFWDILESTTFVCCGCYMLKTREFFSIYPQRQIPESPAGQNFQMLLPYMYRYPCPTIPDPLYGVRVRPDSHSRRRMTQAEEEERRRCFETLMDEICGICGMRHFYEKRRVMFWKLRYERKLALKYGDRWRARRVRAAMLLYRGNRKLEALHKFVNRIVERKIGE